MQEIQRNNVSPVIAGSINYFELQKGGAVYEQGRRSGKRLSTRRVEYLTMGKFVAGQSELPRRPGRGRTSENTALPDRRFPKIVTVAWLTLGIASVALASIAALVLRSERKSTAILQQLNVISLGTC